MPRRFVTSARSGVIAGLSLLLTLGTIGPALAQDATQEAEPSSELTTQLPAVSLPTMNSQGFVFEITSAYNGTPSGTPAQAPVYAMNEQTLDIDETKAVADKLGIGGDVQDDGSGTYTVSGDGTLYATAGLVQYVSATETQDGDLGDDASIIATAREWLRGTGQLPANIGDGSIQAKIESPARAIVIFQPVSPNPLLSSTPNITVTVGPNGSVYEAAWRWADITQADTYQLRPLDQAFAEVSDRRAYLQASLPSDQFADGSSIAGNAVYSSVSLAYASSGVPGETQYLQPVYVFTGTLTPEGSDASYPITAYVPALVNSNQPVG